MTARLPLIATALAAAHAAVAVFMAVAPNPEGPVAGLGYAVMYVLPAMLVALALWSRRAPLRLAAGWVALLLAALYAGVVLGNWAGSSPQEAAVSLAVNVPTAAVDLLVFGATVLTRVRPKPAGA